MYGEDRKSEEEKDEKGKLPGEEDEEKRNELLKEEIVEPLQNNGNNLLLLGTQDVVEKKYVFSCIDIGFVLFGIGTLLLDWVSDIIAVHKHWHYKDFMWFTMTVVFMSSSSLVIMGVSLWCIMGPSTDPCGTPLVTSLHSDLLPLTTVRISLPTSYIKDRNKEGAAEVSRGRWVARFILLPLQLAPLLRYYDTLAYGLKSRKHWKRYRKSGSEEDASEQKKYYDWMRHEESDCSFLRMFECFMESAPQLILQLYILIRTNDPFKYSTNWRFVISMTSFFSLVSLAWGVTAFMRSTRFTDYEKKNISIAGSAAIFFWQFLTLVARVTAMVMFASVFQQWLVYVCAAHCVVMVAWLLSRRLENLRSSPLWQITLSILMGIIYIFVFLNDEDEPTRWKYIIYYTIYEVENVVMIVIWLLYSNPTTAYYLPVVISHFFAFFLGLVFMQVYYNVLHPNISPPHLQCQQPQDEESRELETQQMELQHVHEC